MLSPIGACDCGGSETPSDPADVGQDSDTGGGDTGEDVSADTAADTAPDSTEDADTAPDTEPDADPDTSEDTDADVPEERAERALVFTSSGGGVVESENTRAVIGIGAPQPAGTAAGEDNSVTTGPAAARP